MPPQIRPLEMLPATVFAIGRSGWIRKTKMSPKQIPVMRWKTAPAQNCSVAVAPHPFGPQGCTSSRMPLNCGHPSTGMPMILYQ